MHVDATLTLAQLTGIDWGPAPEGASWLVQERHALRRTALANLTLEGLERLLSLDFQSDYVFLIPHCLERLGRDDVPVVAACNLLLLLLVSEKYPWLTQPNFVHRVRELIARAEYKLYLENDSAEQTSDSLEYYRVLLSNTRIKASLYEGLARFEQRISKVEVKGSEANQEL